MAAEIETIYDAREGFSKNLGAVLDRITAAPADGLEAWARTTTAVVALLIGIQMATGIMLAFNYVPTVAAAHTTVAYIEQSAGAGSWIRSLHFHTSVLLPVAILIHLAQMIGFGAWRRGISAWTFGVVLLGLVLAAGATGYALPWDARSWSGVNIAASLAGNVPLAGEFLRKMLQGGDSISTITLSRFFGLHAFVIPSMILFAVVLRLFVFTGTGGANGRALAEYRRRQLVRSSVVAGLMFAALGVYSLVIAAPLAPPAPGPATFLPRPGPQFLWLFELQKYTEGALSSVIAFGMPGLIMTALMLIAYFHRRIRFAAPAMWTAWALAVLIPGGLTAVALVQDSADEKIAAQLRLQDREEAEFRQKPFVPMVTGNPPPPVREESPANSESSEPATLPIPASYVKSCAKCHGSGGEGKGASPSIRGLATRAEEPRSDEDLLEIINDPASFGLSSKMPSYRNKLTEDEKRELVQWIRTLE